MSTFIRFHRFIALCNLQSYHDSDQRVYRLLYNGTVVYSVPERVAWRSFDDQVEEEIKFAMNLCRLFG